MAQRDIAKIVRRTLRRKRKLLLVWIAEKNFLQIQLLAESGAINAILKNVKELKERKNANKGSHYNISLSHQFIFG